MTEIDCLLCSAERVTDWLHEDEDCWVAECTVCRTPMVVWRIHGLPDAQLEARIQSFEQAYRMQLEATDAFDPKGERLILEMLHRELPDAGVITISFHPGLEPLHQRKIVLTRLRETKYL